MMSANVSGLVSGADIAAGHALFDELDERVVQVESALDGIATGGQHFPDHLPVGVTRFDQRDGDVVEHADKARRDRLVATIEENIV